MTERGLPSVGDAPACPFVAFEDDRDERATSPDHRHRCYAEPQPAPRALAHQEAYCLSSSFPVCPTFQDWARREAARARTPDIPPDDFGDAEPAEEDAEAYAPPLVDDRPPRRGSRHVWSAPPPWARETEPGQESPPAGEGGPPSAAASAAMAGAAGAAASRGGLSGSMADRFASGQQGPDTARPPEPRPPHAEPPRPSEDDYEDEAAAAPPPASHRQRERFEAGPDRDDESRSADVVAPSWERPRRLEAYPTLRSRRLSSAALPPILIGIVALALAGLGIFFLPTFLGIGSPPSGSPAPSTASVAPSASLEPTLEPEPTPFVYVIKPGDTLERLRKKYGVTLQAILDANPEIKDPDKISIGQEIIIPIKTPTKIPAASAEASP